MGRNPDVSIVVVECYEFDHLAHRIYCESEEEADKQAKGWTGENPREGSGFYYSLARIRIKPTAKGIAKALNEAVRDLEDV